MFKRSGKNVGSGQQVMIFALSLLIQRGLYRLASLLLQDYQKDNRFNLKSLKLEENIDDPKLCSVLKEATKAYIEHGRIKNGTIEENIKDRIRSFIEDNPPD